MVSISDTIKSLVPEIRLGLISADVVYEKENKYLQKAINEEINRISGILIEMVKDIPQIHSSREAYKALGKEPARYRLSAEALHRRIIKGKGIYQISNLVDTINLASVKTGYSIGGYDEAMIEGNVIFDLGKKDEDYKAIGRGKMNIENLPVFRDEKSAFGSPTSDSVRTMITENTSKIFLIVINFGGHSGFENELKEISDLFVRYCSAENVKVDIV
jgi:DNA/RNA-binding domain of Phe-tRNA-synthetase-like protein